MKMHENNILFETKPIFSFKRNLRVYCDVKIKMLTFGLYKIIRRRIEIGNLILLKRIKRKRKRKETGKKTEKQIT